MPNLDVVALNFRGGVRVGKRGLELEETLATIPSDTLFSAMVSAWRLLGGNVDEFLKPFLADPPNPPFLITSTFPRAGEVRFYPAPVDLSLCISPDKLKDYGKKIKKVQYLFEGLFLRLLKGEKLDAWLFSKDDGTTIAKGWRLQKGALWLSEEEIARLPKTFPLKPENRSGLMFQEVWKDARQPHVTVDRIGSQPEIYHTTQVHFHPDCGLWFGILWRDGGREIPSAGMSYRRALEKILQYLEHAGLGGKRAIGFGAFAHTLSPAAVEFPLPASGQAGLLLSRYHPRPTELPQTLQHEKASYQLVSVGGWLKTPDSPNLMRKRLHMFSEGSVLAFPQLPAGDLSDVTPDIFTGGHRIYRYGMALAAGLEVQNA